MPDTKPRIALTDDEQENGVDRMMGRAGG